MSQKFAPNKQLYKLTGSNFSFPIFVDKDGRVESVVASGIPILMWPNGQLCLPGNLFMLKLYERGLSRRERGGTLATYAVNISHLLRFAYSNSTQLHRLTDNQFTLFIGGLQGEWRATNPAVRARNANSVIAIGCCCLEFLELVGSLYQLDNFIAPNGQILAERKRREYIGNGRNSKEHSTWHHRSFPTPDALNERMPVSTQTIELLRNAVAPCSKSIFQRRRRYVMLRLLEITGGRRSEVAAITVDSITKASMMQEPMLKLLTVKGRHGKDSFRFIPIARHDIEYILDFIEKSRARIIRKTCGHANDDGYLLVSEKTGKKIRPNTITQEVSTIANSIPLKEKPSPHLFRHRYITKLFVALIEQHNFENEDEFRRMLITSEDFKQKVQQWSGHRRLSSLDRYIHLAFEEIAHLKQTCNVVKAKCAIDSFKASLAEVAIEIQNGGAIAENALHLLKLTQAISEDLATTVVGPELVK